MKNKRLERLYKELAEAKQNVQDHKLFLKMSQQNRKVLLRNIKVAEERVSVFNHE